MRRLSATQFTIKIGKHLEKELDQVRNEFCLPFYGIQTTSTNYIQYNKPKNPDEIRDMQFWFNVWRGGGITDEVYAEKMGLEANQIPQPQNLPDSAQQTVTNKYLRADSGGQLFKSALVRYAKKETPTDTAVKSEDYAKFKSRLEKAFTRQLKDYISKLENYDNPEEIQQNLTKDLSKLESYYGFKTLKQDLLKFAGLGLDEFYKTLEKYTIQGYKLRKDYFSGEYPQIIVDAVDGRTQYLLKGVGDYAGLDGETTQRISSIISANISEGVSVIAQKLNDLVNTMPKSRAEIIAKSEVAEAIEGTRFTMYETEFSNGSKDWTTGVFDVCPICETNESQGKIGISENFTSDDRRPTAHPQCGCTCTYYPD
jgi:hypothetical protein